MWTNIPSPHNRASRYRLPRLSCRRAVSGSTRCQPFCPISDQTGRCQSKSGVGGWETVILLIETTNVSDTPILSAYVELRGAPVLVEAFTRMTPIPVPIGEFTAGEKRTAEIREGLPQVKDALTGELLIGMMLSEGLPSRTHIILTEIQSGPTPKKSTRLTPFRF